MFAQMLNIAVGWANMHNTQTLPTPPYFAGRAEVSGIN